MNLPRATATAKITPHPHQHQGLRSGLGCRDGRWGAAQGHWSKPWFQKLGESSWPSVSCRCKPVESIASTGREAPSGQSFSKPGLTMNIQPKKGPQQPTTKTGKLEFLYLIHLQNITKLPWDHSFGLMMGSVTCCQWVTYNRPTPWMGSVMKLVMGSIIWLVSRSAMGWSQLSKVCQNSKVAPLTTTSVGCRTARAANYKPETW